MQTLIKAGWNYNRSSMNPQMEWLLISNGVVRSKFKTEMTMIGNITRHEKTKTTIQDYPETSNIIWVQG